MRCHARKGFPIPKLANVSHLDFFTPLSYAAGAQPLNERHTMQFTVIQGLQLMECRRRRDESHPKGVAEQPATPPTAAVNSV